MNRQQIIEEVLDGRAGWIEADEKGLRAKRIHDLAQEIDACLAAQAQQQGDATLGHSVRMALEEWGEVVTVEDEDGNTHTRPLRHGEQPQQGAVVEAAARAAVLISHYGCVEDRDDLTLPLDDSLDEVAAQEAIAWIRENPTPAAPAPSEPTDTERMGDLQYDIEEILIDAEPRNDSPGQLAHNIMEKVRAAVDAAMKQQGGGA